MKNIIKKISCLVAVVVIVLASFILPASAAEGEGSIPKYVDFLDDAYKDNVQYGVNGGSYNGRYVDFSSETDAYFYIGNSVSFSLSYDWFAFVWEFETDKMIDGDIIYRHGGSECTLFTIMDNKVRLFHSGGIVLYTLPPEGVDNDNEYCQISCMLNVKTNMFFYSVDNTISDPIDFGSNSVNISSNLRSSSYASNRYFYFTSRSSQTYANPYFMIHRLELYEFPNNPLGLGASEAFNFYVDIFHHPYLKEFYKDFYEKGYTAGSDAGYSGAYDDGYSQGLTDGYDMGFDDGENYDLGFSKGVVEGYNNGLYDGYQQGATDVYNELYEKGLEVIDENEGTLMQGFLSGMWNGVQNFVQELLDGITFSDLSLRKIVTTLLAIMLAAFVIRVIKG